MTLMQGLRIAACGVAVATFVFMGLGALRVGGVMDWIPLWFTPFVALAFLAPSTVGLLIALRKPRNTIAWILLLGAFALTLQLPLALVLSEGWSLQMDRALWPLLYAWPIAVAYVFPDGRLLSRRWRWVVLGAVTCWVGFIAIALLDPEPFYGEDASVPNPLADNAVAGWMEGAGLGGSVVRVLARDPGQPLRRCARDPASPAQVDRHREAADDVARLDGGADPPRAGDVRDLLVPAGRFRDSTGSCSRSCS